MIRTPAILLIPALLLCSCSPDSSRPAFARISESSLPVAGGGASLLYSPPAGTPADRAVLFLHGGAMIVGSPTNERFDEFCRNLALHGHEVLSLDYPLLWQGLDRTSGSALVHEGLRTLAARGHSRIAVVAASAGAWIAARGLEDARREGWKELEKVDRFGGVSPLLSPEAGVLRRALLSIYERGDPAGLDPAALPRMLMVQGDADWIVPAGSAVPLCDAKGPKDCTRITVPGGHFQLHKGLAGTPESGEAFLRFLAER